MDRIEVETGVRPRYEAVDGELLVSPSPSLAHQKVLAVLWRAIDAYVTAHRIGIVLFSPMDIPVTPRSVVNPDLFVLPSGPDGRKPSTRDDLARLLLVAEVLSPSTARHDRTTKRVHHLRSQVPEYWIVDPDVRVVERWRPDDLFRPEVLHERMAWQPDPASPPLSLDLPAVFREALDQ